MSDKSNMHTSLMNQTGPNLKELEEQLASIRGKIDAACSDELRDDLNVLEDYFQARVDELSAVEQTEEFSGPQPVAIEGGFDATEGVWVAAEPAEYKKNTGLAAMSPRGWMMELRWTFELGWVRSMFDLKIERGQFTRRG